MGGASHGVTGFGLGGTGWSGTGWGGVSGVSGFSGIGSIPASSLPNIPELPKIPELPRLDTLRMPELPQAPATPISQGRELAQIDEIDRGSVAASPVKLAALPSAPVLSAAPTNFAQRFAKLPKTQAPASPVEAQKQEESSSPARTQDVPITPAVPLHTTTTNTAQNQANSPNTFNQGNLSTEQASSPTTSSLYIDLIAYEPSSMDILKQVAFAAGDLPTSRAPGVSWPAVSIPAHSPVLLPWESTATSVTTTNRVVPGNLQHINRLPSDTESDETIRVAASPSVTFFSEHEAGFGKDESAKFGNTGNAFKGTATLRSTSSPVTDLAQVHRITGSSVLPEVVAHKGMPSLASSPVRLEAAYGVDALGASTGEIVAARVAGARSLTSVTFSPFSGTTANSAATRGYVSKSIEPQISLSLTEGVFVSSSPAIPSEIPQISAIQRVSEIPQIPAVQQISASSPILAVLTTCGVVLPALGLGYGAWLARRAAKNAPIYARKLQELSAWHAAQKRAIKAKTGIFSKARRRKMDKLAAALARKRQDIRRRYGYNTSNALVGAFLSVTSVGLSVATWTHLPSAVSRVPAQPRLPAQPAAVAPIEPVQQVPVAQPSKDIFRNGVRIVTIEGKEFIDLRVPPRTAEGWKIYGQAVQTYLDRTNANGKVFDGTPLTGAMFAAVARETFEATGIYFPLKLKLGQGQNESSFGRFGRSAANNPYNIGEWDDKTVLAFDRTQDGMVGKAGTRAYEDLMIRDYFVTEPFDTLVARHNGDLDAAIADLEASFQKLMTDFVNRKGCRYASDKEYESKIARIAAFVKKYLAGEGYLLRSVIKLSATTQGASSPPIGDEAEPVYVDIHAGLGKGAQESWRAGFDVKGIETGCRRTTAGFKGEV